MVGNAVLDFIRNYTGYGLTTLIAAGCGAYFGAYLKKKGENLATHEDLAALVEQMKAVTNATKEIEAKISTDMWHRQNRWEMRKDAILEALRDFCDSRPAGLENVVDIFKSPNRF